MNEKFKTLLSFAFISTLALVLLEGCASVPKVEANYSTKAQLKRIALIPIGEPQSAQIVNLGGTAGAFGLIGGIVQGSLNEEHSKGFTNAIKDIKPSLSSTLTESLIQALKLDGYEVFIAEGQSVKPSADKKRFDFSDVHVDADAIACVQYNVVGYMSSPYSKTYEPWVVVRAQIVDAKTREDIYFKLFCVGYKMKIENSVSLPANGKFKYNNFEDIMNHVSDAFSGLSDSSSIAASQIGVDFKK